jgi:hypothetical protein
VRDWRDSNIAIKKKETEKKHCGVYEKKRGSGKWWVRDHADGKIKREKIGRKSDAIVRHSATAV